MHAMIRTWQHSLGRLLLLYDTHRGNLRTFFPKLFGFFVILNIACYWWAMFTAFPELTHGSAGAYYFKVQFPVGLLGALFDSLSFFVTVFIVRRALRSRHGAVYVTHLSLDLVIAALATLWVLFVFSFSGWLINLLDIFADMSAVQETLGTRNQRYERMLVEAASRPGDNLRNIYFGLIMGISAGLPTCVHVSLFLRSLLHKLAGCAQDDASYSHSISNE